jgi:hypothetical protein
MCSAVVPPKALGLQICQPKAFRQAGYYPTQYCVRQARQGQRTVSRRRARVGHKTESTQALYTRSYGKG